MSTHKMLIFASFGVHRIWMFLLFIKGTLCNIDRLELVMPRYAFKGGEVTLKCDHSVKLEDLYKVEWRKGENKIFTYIKGRQPPFQHWEILGAKLSRSNSSEKQVHLTNLTFAAGGSYYCVVSMETPIFTKDSDSKDLTIIDPQDRDPQITFKKETYYIGEMLEANCTTSPSSPPAHITWFINDEKVQDSLTKSFSIGQVYGRNYFESRVSSIKQLSIEVSQLHGGEDGRLRLACMATIPGYVNKGITDYADMRNATVDIEIMEETPALPSPVEAASSGHRPLLHHLVLLKLFLTLAHY
ncbi:uncharacterized protein [Euwallacea fornicatus]|uniref:uncharacterized protein isoform X2 n=1 Tax=Euwallacea fornicatus TaxID=995702 RepID=UPI00338D3ADA